VTRSCLWKLNSRSDDKGVWLPDERGEMIDFNQDECIRPGTNFEALMNLNPIPGVVSYGGNEIVITPGNSSPTNDGVSAILVMSEEKALALGLEPMARIIGFGVAGVKPQLMGLGPVPATKKAMKYAGLTMDQIDRVEFNEAFAAQIIPSARELGIPMEKLNVNGGALAIGHAPPARGWCCPWPTSCAAPTPSTAWPPNASAPAWASPQ